MSLQDIVDWWNNYSKEKQKILSCGAWPLSIPPQFDPFLGCCAPHDEDYHDSEILYAMGVIDNNEDLKREALQIKGKADENFIACVRARYFKSWFFTRPLTRLWGEEYIDIVLANGNRIWFQSVGVIIAEHESGDSVIVRLAIRSAMKDGTENEKEAIKQAYSLAGKAKTSD